MRQNACSAKTKKNVVSVALEVGYANPSSFAQLFGRETGLSPAITLGSVDADSFQRKDAEAQRDGVTPFAGIRITAAFKRKPDYATDPSRSGRLAPNAKGVC
jgi:AraC-like DNA-binding protein